MIRWFLPLLLLCACSSPKQVAAPKPAPIKLDPACPEKVDAYDDDATHASMLGNRRVVRVCLIGSSNADVRAAIKMKAEDTIDPKALRSDLEALASLPIIEDATIAGTREGDNVVLLYVVRERPEIAEITLENAPHFKTIKLKTSELEHKPFSPRTVHAFLQKVVEGYEEEGWRDAKATFEPVTAGDKVKLRIKVDEGNQHILKKVVFDGAKNVSQAELEKSVSYLNQPISADALLKVGYEATRTYYSRGYLMMRIDAPTTTVTPDGSVTVTWKIEEGDQFRLGSLKLGKGLEKMDADLLPLLKVKQGEIFNATKMKEGMTKMEEWFKTKKDRVITLDVMTDIEKGKKLVNVTIEAR